MAPITPNPNNPAWHKRCFDCFTVGHKPGACEGHMICLRCRHSGHAARDCPSKATGRAISSAEHDRPRGCRDEQELPKNKPHEVFSFVHETAAMSAELRSLKEAIVVDAQFVTGQSSSSVAHDLSRDLKWSSPFRLTYLRDRQYLLRLPATVSRDQ